MARFACDVTVEGEPWPYCPRTILRNMLDAGQGAGFELKMGAELEYFLVRRTDDGGIEVADKLDTLELPCYDMRALTRNLDFVSQVSHAVTALGWDNYATDHEDANGQFEQNFEYDDALITCDRAVFFRYMVESLAQQRGLIATFMPKPFAHLTGNGCHFHFSLWSGGQNPFVRDPAQDPRGLGLSELAYQFIAGLKANAKAYIASPRQPSTPTSGSSWGRRTAARRGRRHTSATATTTARRCFASPRRGGSRTARWTAHATPTSAPAPCSRRASTGSSENSTRASRTPPTYTS